MKYSKYFSLKIIKEKSIFHFQKQNLNPLGILCMPQNIWLLETLLARLYLKVKVYITKLLGVYIVYKKPHALNEVIFFGFLNFWGFLWPWKLTFIEHWMNVNFTILFPWYLLKLWFFTRCLYFHHNWWKERGTKINSSNIFKGCLGEKKFEIHNTVDSQ